MHPGITTTRPACADDTAFLYGVFVSSREDEFSLIDWPPEKIEVLMQQQFELQTKGYGSLFPGAENLVILFNGEPVGRVLINESDTEIRMVDIAILKPFRRRGIGRTITRRFMDAAEKSRKPLRHHVYHGELDATRFYFALGYRVIRKEEAGYQMEWTPASLAGSPQADAARS